MGWGKKKREEAAAAEAMRELMQKEAAEIAKQETLELEAEEAAEAEANRARDLAFAEAEAAAKEAEAVGPGRQGWLAVKTVSKTLFGQKTAYDNHFFTLYKGKLRLREAPEFNKEPIATLQITENTSVQLRVVPGVKDPNDTRLIVVNTPKSSVEMMAGTLQDARGWMGAFQHFRTNVDIDLEGEAAKDPQKMFMMEAAKLAAAFMLEPADHSLHSIDGEVKSDEELVAAFPDMSKRRYMEVHFKKQLKEDIGIRLVGGSGPGSNPQKPFIYVASCRPESLGSKTDLRKGDIINKVNKRVLKDVTLKEAQSIFDRAAGKMKLGVARSRKEPFIRQPYHDEGLSLEEEETKRLEEEKERLEEEKKRAMFTDVTVELKRDDVSEAWGFDTVVNDENQLVVTDIVPLTEADGSVEPDDIVVSVNGQTAEKLGATFHLLATKVIDSRPRVKLVLRRLATKFKKRSSAGSVYEGFGDEGDETVNTIATVNEGEELDFSSGASGSVEESSAAASSGNSETVQKADEEESFGFGASPSPSPVKAPEEDTFLSSPAEDDGGADGAPPPPPAEEPPATPAKHQNPVEDTLSPLPETESPEKAARKARLARMRASRKMRKGSMHDELSEILSWIDNLPDDY